MNCPYCDESVHVMSKFCPKCGLPLKDDATVMGAYATDDTGPSIYVIGGGAAAVLAIALIIGWATSRNEKKPIEQVQRQPITTSYTGPNSGAAILPGGFGTPGFAPPSAPSADYSPRVKWAYTPPPETPRPQRVFVPEPSGPEAPTHNIVQEMRSAPKQPSTVAMARVTTPQIPVGPSVPEPPTLLPGQVMTVEPTASTLVETVDETSALPRLNEEGQELERRGIITYDPVQEQYVIVPGRTRRNQRYREIAPRSPAPILDGQ